LRPSPVVRSVTVRVPHVRPAAGSTVARTVQPSRVPAEYRAAEMARRQAARIEGSEPRGDFLEGLANAMKHLLHFPGF
jgi:hypothetical protein